MVSSTKKMVVAKKKSVSVPLRCLWVIIDMAPAPCSQVPSSYVLRFSASLHSSNHTPGAHAVDVVEGSEPWDTESITCHAAMKGHAFTNPRLLVFCF